MIAKGYNEMKKGKYEVKEALLDQLPEILFTLFNVPENKGNTLMTANAKRKSLNKSNVSMNSDTSIAGQITSVIYQASEKYINNAKKQIMGP